MAYTGENVLNQEKQLATKPSTRKMPIFTCSCGKQILIVPDLKVMNKAIETHVAEHRRLTRQRITEDEIVDRIMALLSHNFL